MLMAHHPILMVRQPKPVSLHPNPDLSSFWDSNLWVGIADPGDGDGDGVAEGLHEPNYLLITVAKRYWQNDDTETKRKR
jgi:hypothetical protein